MIRVISGIDHAVGVGNMKAYRALFCMLHYEGGEHLLQFFFILINGRTIHSMQVFDPRPYRTFQGF